MRIKNIETKLIISIPYNQQDLNNVVYTENSVLKAYKTSLAGIPVMFKDVILGYVKDSKIISNDKENCILKIEITCNIPFGGTEEIVELNNNKVISYEIISIGFST